ncbi:serpin-ZX-like [Lotus japonicus]|uniref:serpin-ZX-like n=1 Tax=Lotus japonicus TaxID=34305 RepID=UPI00258D922B|nr:serpin-ZX-like [Lotus japonicus]
MDLKKSKPMRRQTDVALSITKHLFSKEDYHDKNVVFSPFSLNAALSVMAAGSSGRTLDELLTFLRVKSVDHLTTFYSHLISAVLSSDDAAPSYHLSFANGMWADDSLSLSHSFKQLVATHYRAALASVDFQNKGDQVHSEVNSWVKKETNGLITGLLPPRAVGKLTRLIFANTLHFKGVWEDKFSPTYRDNFHLLNGTSVEVRFMTSKKKQQFIRAFDGFQVLRLSYEQGTDKKRRFSMYIFLPDAKDGLPALIEKLASDSNFLKDKLLPQHTVWVHDFKIPKFKISFGIKASNVLKELGVVSPFSQQNADFTKMVDGHVDELYVENIFHKAFIKVNEEGTEAGAGIVMHGATKGFSDVRASRNFVADHPFLFLIREDFAGTILFIGQVLNPREGAATPVKFLVLLLFTAKKDVGKVDEDAHMSYIEDLEVPSKRKRKRKRSSKVYFTERM